MFDRELVETLDIYDLVTGQWEVMTRVERPRYLASLVVMEDTLHLIGGFTNGQHDATRSMERYDLTCAQWLPPHQCPVEIWEHLSCVLYIPTCREDEEITSQGLTH